MTLILRLEKQLENAIKWVDNADTKSSIFVAIQAITAATGLLNSLSIIYSDKFLNISPFALTMLILSILCYFKSIFHSFYSLCPVLTHTASSKSLIFFGSVGELSGENFLKLVKKQTDAERELDLANQVVIVSKIANQKQTEFSNALVSFIYFGLFTIAFNFLYQG